MLRTRLHRFKWVLLILIALLAGVGAGVFYDYQRHQPTRQARQAVSELFKMQMPDAQGKPVNLAQWRGRPVVINFWATWCGPCRKEMPMLDAAARKYAPLGVQFVGIGIDEKRAIERYSSDNPTHYPLLVGNMALFDLMSRLGNSIQALPFSVIVNADGSVRQTRLGALNETELEKMLSQLSSTTSNSTE